MIEPYFQTCRVTLYHADCRDVLPELGAHDLIVTDPPYGVDFQSNRRAEQFDLMAGDDDADSIVSILDDAVRSNLRRGRHAYVFGPLDLSSLVDGGLVQEPVELIWDKQIMSMGNLQIPWASSHEAIQFLVAVKSKANVDKGDGHLTARLRRGSILRHQRPHAAAAHRHPTEKPVPLLRELIESSSRVDEVVLDPFAGVGSTLVAALLEGRRAVGIEIDERYCATAADRLRAATTALASVA